MSRLLVFLISLFALQVQAATYYVSTSGSDSNNGTSTATPFATGSKAITTSSSGDTILFKRGDTWNMSAHYAINKSLTIDAYGTGAKPKFAFPSDWSVPSDKGIGGFNVTATNVTINNVRIEYPFGAGIKINVGSNNYASDGVETYRPGQTSQHARFLTGVHIKNCLDIENNRNWVNKLYSDWGGGTTIQGVSNAVIEGCTSINGVGEAIAAYDGASDFIFRNNRVHGARSVGVYVNNSWNGEVYGNIVTGTVNTSQHRSNPGYVGNCFATANESYYYLNSDGSLKNQDKFVHDVHIYNNIGAFCDYGLRQGNGGEVPDDNHGNIITHNLFVDNKYGVLLNTHNVDTLFTNNIVLSISGGTSDTVGGIAGVTLRNNAWSTTPPAGFQGTGDVNSGIALAKMTGWQSLSAVDDVTIADFTPTVSSTTLNAGSNNYGALAYLYDILNNTVDSTPDLGPVQYGSTPVDPPASGSSITSLSAAIAASTADYAATGTELSGVYSAVIKTGATSEALTGVIGKADGTGFVFDTGALTGINLNDYTITATTDTPAYINFTPRSWTGTNVTNTNNTTPYWIFDAAANITTTSGARATIGTLAGVEVGDVLTIELFVVQNAATVASFRVQNTGNAQSAVYLASPTTGSMVQNSNNIFSGTPTIAKTTEKGVTKFTITGTAAYASDYTFLLGTGNDPDLLTALGLRVYKNLSPKTVDYTHTAITAPTISVVNADDVIIPNAENTITGTGLSQLKSITLSNAGGSITYPVVVGQGTTAKFRVADLTGLDNGSVTLTANYGQLLYESYAPASWANNTATAAVDYPTTILGMADAVTFASDGNQNASLAVDNVFNMTAGQDIQTVFYTEQGTSGRLRAVLQNKTSGEYADSVGIFGALASTGTTMFSGTPTVTEHKIQNMTALTFDGAAASGGSVKIGVGPYTTTVDQNVHIFGFKALAGPFSNITHSVTKSSTGTPEPTLVKKLKLGTPLSKITRNGVPATFKYTSVKVYDKNPATDRTAQVLVELVGPYNVGLQEYEGISVVDGIASATEADVLVGSGSLNALANGTYWVLSSRPSNGTLAISLTNIQLVTE